MRRAALLDSRDSMSASQPEYALGRSAREYARLTLQAELLRPISQRAFAEAGIAGGMRVLDLGSGAGDVCLLLGEMVGPTGEVIGLDVDGDAVEHARRRRGGSRHRPRRLQCGDFAQYVPAAPLDAIAGRLVLCYQADPAAALAAVLPHLRPGGIVAFQESWMMPTPGPDSVTKRTATLHRGDLEAGRARTWISGPRLHRVFVEAGLPQPQMRMEVLMDGREDSPLYRYLGGDVAQPAAEGGGVRDREGGGFRCGFPGRTVECGAQGHGPRDDGDADGRGVVPEAGLVTSPAPLGGGEVEVLLPIVGGDVVFAGADVVADVVADGLVEAGHLHGADAFLAEELPDGRGIGGAEEFALRVAPLIALGAGDVESARSDQARAACGNRRASRLRARCIF